MASGSGTFNIYLTTGCLPYGSLSLSLAAPLISLQGINGSFGISETVIPGLKTSLAGVVYPRWTGIILPMPKTSVTGLDSYSRLNISLPAPKTSVTGSHVHEGSFSVVFQWASMMMMLPLDEDYEPADWLLSSPVVNWKTGQPATGWSTGLPSS